MFLKTCNATVMLESEQLVLFLVVTAQKELARIGSGLCVPLSHPMPIITPEGQE